MQAHFRFLLLSLITMTCDGFVLNQCAPLNLRYKSGVSRVRQLASMQETHGGYKSGAKQSQCQFSMTTPKFSQNPLIPAAAVAATSLLVLAPTAVFAAGPEWLEPTRVTLDIALAIFSTLFFIRIPMTWYPQMDLNQFPQNLAAW